MRQILRVDLVLAQFSDDPRSLEIRIEETVRRAQKRTICCVQTGGRVDEESLELAMQLLEDTIRAALGRTLGITQQLAF